MLESFPQPSPFHLLSRNTTESKFCYSSCIWSDKFITKYTEKLIKIQQFLSFLSLLIAYYCGSYDPGWLRIVLQQLRFVCGYLCPWYGRGGGLLRWVQDCCGGPFWNLCGQCLCDRYVGAYFGTVCMDWAGARLEESGGLRGLGLLHSFSTCALRFFFFLFL